MTSAKPTTTTPTTSKSPTTTWTSSDREMDYEEEAAVSYPRKGGGGTSYPAKTSVAAEKDTLSTTRTSTSPAPAAAAAGKKSPTLAVAIAKSSKAEGKTAGFNWSDTTSSSSSPSHSIASSTSAAESTRSAFETQATSQRDQSFFKPRLPYANTTKSYTSKGCKTRGCLGFPANAQYEYCPRCFNESLPNRCKTDGCHRRTRYELCPSCYKRTMPHQDPTCRKCGEPAEREFCPPCFSNTHACVNKNQCGQDAKGGDRFCGNCYVPRFYPCIDPMCESGGRTEDYDDWCATCNEDIHKGIAKYCAASAKDCPRLVRGDNDLIYCEDHAWTCDVCKSSTTKEICCLADDKMKPNVQVSDQNLGSADNTGGGSVTTHTPTLQVPNAPIPTTQAPVGSTTLKAKLTTQPPVVVALTSTQVLNNNNNNNNNAKPTTQTPIIGSTAAPVPNAKTTIQAIAAVSSPLTIQSTNATIPPPIGSTNATSQGPTTTFTTQPPIGPSVIPVPNNATLTAQPPMANLAPYSFANFPSVHNVHQSPFAKTPWSQIHNYLHYPHHPHQQPPQAQQVPQPPPRPQQQQQQPQQQQPAFVASSVAVVARIHLNGEMFDVTADGRILLGLSLGYSLLQTQTRPA